jgi:hypothetical protein
MGGTKSGAKAETIYRKKLFIEMMLADVFG